MDDNVLQAAELSQLRIDECFVYKLTNRTASGHRAEDWGLDKPIVTGVMKVVQKDDELYIRFYENKKSTLGSVVSSELVLFAECPIKLENNMVMVNFVESVVDSSRYFVFRVVEPKTQKHMFIGAGFRERQSAFDFRATLQDFEKFVSRQKMASDQCAHDETNAEDRKPLPPPQFNDELRLKEGQKIKVNLKMKVGVHSSSRKPNTSSTTSNTLLPPPMIKPPSTTITHRDEIVGSANDDDDDEWGDFVSS